MLLLLPFIPKGHLPQQEIEDVTGHGRQWIHLISIQGQDSLRYKYNKYLCSFRMCSVGL